jgi:hypothetical protein
MEHFGTVWNSFGLGWALLKLLDSSRHFICGHVRVMADAVPRAGRRPWEFLRFGLVDNTYNGVWREWLRLRNVNFGNFVDAAEAKCYQLGSQMWSAACLPFTAFLAAWSGKRLFAGEVTYVRPIKFGVAGSFVGEPGTLGAGDNVGGQSGCV